MVYTKASPNRNAPLREAYINPAGVRHMHVDLVKLNTLIHKRADEIEKSVAGTGYLARTIIGVGTYLLDNEGDLDLLSAKQKLTFERFILPLLEVRRR
jgi:hypothetical protein